MLDRINAHFARHGWGFWALEERESGALIGLCGLAHIPWEAFFTPAVEIDWRLSTPWQGKGLAREAAETALMFAFDCLRLNRCFKCDPTGNHGLANCSVCGIPVNLQRLHTERNSVSLGNCRSSCPELVSGIK